MEENLMPQLGTQPMEQLHVKDDVAWHNIISLHMPRLTEAEATERKAH